MSAEVTNTRDHATRASLYWMLAQILGTPMRPVDIETLRAMVDTVEPPAKLGPSWRALTRALSALDSPEHPRVLTYSAIPVLPKAWARDLRTLALRCDELARDASTEGPLDPELRARLLAAARMLAESGVEAYAAAGHALEAVLDAEPAFTDGCADAA